MIEHWFSEVSNSHSKGQHVGIDYLHVAGSLLRGVFPTMWFQSLPWISTPRNLNCTVNMKAKHSFIVLTSFQEP